MNRDHQRPRGRSPRATLVRIATGRDAADIAFVTTLPGRLQLSTVEVQAVAPSDLPVDDHEQFFALDVSRTWIARTLIKIWS
jgi:hypothetical protein